MDKYKVQRLALLGAAKVAFSATLVGCGGVVVFESQTSATAGAGGSSSSEMKPVPWTTAATTSASTTATTSTGETMGQCNVPASAPYSDATVGCCDALVEATFPANAPPPQMYAYPADVVACCDVVMTESTKAPMPSSSSSGVPYSSRYQCCQVPGVTPKPTQTCAPWGPPVPPAMIDGLDWLEEAA